jgi:hypothetical protein
VRSVRALLRLQVGQPVKLRQREAKELLFELSWIVLVGLVCGHHLVDCVEPRVQRVLRAWFDAALAEGVADDELELLLHQVRFGPLGVDPVIGQYRP